MTAMPDEPESSSPSTAESTTRFGGRALFAAVALALLAVPFALTLLLMEDKWAPLLRADSGARDTLHRFAVTRAGFVTTMQLISDSGSALAWAVVLAVVTPACPVRGDHRGRIITAQYRRQVVRPPAPSGPDRPGRQ
jgi:hypothetical protein